MWASSEESTRGPGEMDDTEGSKIDSAAALITSVGSGLNSLYMLLCFSDAVPNLTLMLVCQWVVLGREKIRDVWCYIDLGFEAEESSVSTRMWMESWDVRRADRRVGLRE